ncbi:L-glyceraldehyde 3-phosphate reductase [Paraglaciecola hydrolytica]|uniref:L-glyceraldehyde 3-phosphate reductase n=1 Tax=Paraglaciecola hydrolytica TaxID=1799789 RepID=A0A136A6T5_9ALTE|nr:L-glyceraldehyde 3-phosphate reductase [Paraglaciecola hydrolytica]KXI30840.1 L-glyceraldehyde 3-phosphate reductase [Paraglaciecola hydrolytica]
MIKHDPNPLYVANPTRYENISYRRCGKSGLRLPPLSLGLWQNFGAVDSLQNATNMLHKAFDLGITHFDLANNYGPPFGSAESTFGQVMATSLKPYRDELLISSKAGYDMWAGPYGIGGSRKYLVSSCDQSLKRTGLEYFDIFYSHCMDPETPIEETMQALDYIVRSGRALYVGISNYSPEQTSKAIAILKDLGTPLLIHQPRYNMFDRWIEDGLCDVLLKEGVGSVVFSPLAQGFLTDKYLGGIPQGSRASRSEQIYLNAEHLTQDKIAKVQKLNEIAKLRGQSLAQMALAWVLNNPAVTSSIIGASKVSQIEDCVKALDNLEFSQDELSQIRKIIE